MSALALYLIGEPRVGKSAVFDALTLTPQGPNFTTKSGHRYGTVKVPDARLEALNAMYRPKKFTPAEVTFVDLAPGGNEPVKFGELTGLLGNADALVAVIQCFGDTDFSGAPLDPAAQMESLLLELIVADLEKVERRLERIAQDRHRGQKVSETELKLLERLRAELSSDRPLRDLALRDDEEKLLRTYQFLSQKPLLIVANIGESALADGAPEPLLKAAAARGLEVLPFCAPLEAEIARLDIASQREFLKDYGLTEPARVRLIQAAFRCLRLISFFTVGEDEVRAWPIRDGTNAQAAAGKIHSDMERGFIRAETVAHDALLAAGSLGRCREQGTLRLEGKEYRVRDGDVIHFRFGA